MSEDKYFKKALTRVVVFAFVSAAAIALAVYLGAAGGMQ